MSDSYEIWITKYESARNRAMDAWFEARPHIERNRGSEFIFEAGFRMAYEHPELLEQGEQ